MSLVWTGIAVGVAAVGTSAYSVSKSQSAQKHQDSLVADANRAAEMNELKSITLSKMNNDVNSDEWAGFYNTAESNDYETAKAASDQAIKEYKERTGYNGMDSTQDLATAQSAPTIDSTTAANLAVISDKLDSLAPKMSTGQEPNLLLMYAGVVGVFLLIMFMNRRK